MTTAGTKKASRGKKERFLRYVLRRKPCGYILLGNIVALIVFVACFVGLLLTAIHFSDMNEVFAEEEKILEKYWGNNFTFNHCRYKPAKEWDTSLCATNCGKSAFAFRHRELDTSKEEDNATCIDQIEVALCHPDFDRQCVDLPVKDSATAIKACAGFQGASMGTSMSNEGTDNSSIYVNTLADLSDYLGKNMLANELIMKCPKCRVITTPFYIEGTDDNGKCNRVLDTVKPGWPEFASMCDPLDVVVGNRPKKNSENRMAKRSVNEHDVLTLDQLLDNGVPGHEKVHERALAENDKSEPCVAIQVKDPQRALML